MKPFKGNTPRRVHSRRQNQKITSDSSTPCKVQKTADLENFLKIRNVLPFGSPRQKLKKIFAAQSIPRIETPPEGSFL